MWLVKKGAEPGCLDDLRDTPGADWGSVAGAQKHEMREALCRDQGFVCAYCQSRIAPGDDGPGQMAHVEHWETRASAPDKQFHWRNLLGVCQGDIEEPPLEHLPPPMPGHPETAQVHARFHCDNHRGHLPEAEQELHLRLTEPFAEGSVRFTGAGQVWSDNPGVQTDIKVLNLNIWRLVRNRRAAIDFVASQTGSTAKASFLRGMLVRIEAVDGRGRFLEYSAAMAYLIRRKLASAEARAQR